MGAPEILWPKYTFIVAAYNSMRQYLLQYHFFFFSFTLLLSSFWTSRGHTCRPFSSLVLAFNFIAHRVQQSHCSSNFHRVLLTHALALSASQFEHKKKSPRIYTSMHSAGLELTKLTYLYQARGLPDTPPGRPATNTGT